jgi:uncharacterized membrane protein (UPF0127 family)
MAFLPRLPRIALSLDGEPLYVDIALARTAWSRLRGLAFTSVLPPDAGMMLIPCGGIHMLGMRYPLEAVFLSAGHRVLRIDDALHPWRDFAFCPHSRAVLEWAPGSARRFGIRPGTSLRWNEINMPDIDASPYRRSKDRERTP